MTGMVDANSSIYLELSTIWGIVNPSATQIGFTNASMFSTPLDQWAVNWFKAYQWLLLQFLTKNQNFSTWFQTADPGDALVDQWSFSWGKTFYNQVFGHGLFNELKISLSLLVFQAVLQMFTFVNSPRRTNVCPSAQTRPMVRLFFLKNVFNSGFFSIWKYRFSCK